MAGIVNDNIIFPVLDLIKREARKYYNSINMEGDPFDGEPSVTLYREHPMDEDRVTSADMLYESNWKVSVWMKFGTENEDELPWGIGTGHPDYAYYKFFRLAQVTVRAFNPGGESVVTYNIRLNYDEKGRLTGTSVNRI